MSAASRSPPRRAEGYFEVDVPIGGIAHVLAGKKLNASLLSRIAPGRTLAELTADLDEIAY